MAIKTKTSHGAREPHIIIVPENADSASDFWQTRWEQNRDNCHRLDLGMWDAPHRNTWVNKLNLAIYRADGPVVLVAHGFGCVAVAWWAAYEQPMTNYPVIGALFVTPPDVERPGHDERLARFGACPREAMPFPSFMAVSHNDPGCSLRSALALSRDWGADFADMGSVGHLDSQSHVGDWREGGRLLERLIHAEVPAQVEKQARASSTHPAVFSKDRLRRHII